MSVGVQLTIQVQNVPALSGGVTCVFEDLSNAPGEVRAKGQVMCMSPSLRDLPAQTHSFGKKHTQIHASVNSEDITYPYCPVVFWKFDL